ncbi:hypothetical protein [Xanthomonas melonis]|uniref:hypothetical protein n=1 Tax=Xanthomonas melonis TaxID=56456 RepID=UPI0011B0140C|nr:hypothetical protein [Xanthomonas melonis]MCC4600718.1 hypothetical protein [Xanthomonas melonis]
MNFLKNKIAPFFLAAAATVGVADAAQLNTSFQGWLGKNQKSEFLDPSRWASCYNDHGGECTVVSLTSGTGQCHEESFDLGASFELPAPAGWGPFSLSGSKGSSWSACHERSETTQCQPKPGFRGRAVILMGERFGKLHVNGGTPSSYSIPAYQGCENKWNGTVRLSGRSLERVCTYAGGTYDHQGYLPEFENLTCDYQKI